MAPQAVGRGWRRQAPRGVRAHGAESQVERLSPTQKLSQTRRAARWLTRQVSSIFQLFLGILRFYQDHQDVTMEIGPL